MKSFTEFLQEATEQLEEATYEVDYKGSFATVSAKDESDAINKAAKQLKLGKIALEKPKDFKVKKTSGTATTNGGTYNVTHKTGGGAKVVAKDEKDAINKAAKQLKLGKTALERPQDFKVKLAS